MIILVAVVLLGCASTEKDGAATSPLAVKVRADVKKMTHFATKGDYESVFAMTHPKALELMYRESGGKANSIKQFRDLFDIMERNGINWKVQKIGRETITQDGEKCFAVVPVEMVMVGNGKKATLKSAIIGASYNKGKTWKYINLDGQQGEGVRKRIPEFPSRLTIPKHEALYEPYPKE